MDSLTDTRLTPNYLKQIRMEAETKPQVLPGSKVTQFLLHIHKMFDSYTEGTKQQRLLINILQQQVEHNYKTRQVGGVHLRVCVCVYLCMFMLVLPSVSK